MQSKKKVMKNKIECIDSYLNKVTLNRFFKAVETNNLEITYCNINAHQNKFLNILGKLRVFFILGKYWERNAYCILKKV